MTGEAAPTTPEDRFFGISTEIRKPGTAADGDGSDQLEIEMVDDRAPEDKPRAKLDANGDVPGSEDADDEELASYSESVKKRVNKLTFERNEQKRHREEAERERDEAIRVAQHLASKNQEYEGVLDVGEEQFANTAKQAAQAKLEQAKAAYTRAHESGDTTAILDATEAINDAKAELRNAEQFGVGAQQRKAQREYERQVRAQQAQQPPQPKPQAPDPRASQWFEENPWFQDEDHSDMTALAYGVHEHLIRKEGVTPNTEEYYRRIDEAVRSRFPEYFAGQDGASEQETHGSGRQPTSPPRRPSSVVAPSSRGSGGNPRKVRLTSTQLSLAKKLGVTPERYAAEMLKVETN